ncbi:hypothetical protein LZ31DRAFT_591316 [Colletotrichum somersetense]|nr:hypothetical protein LZ31DRAFT_591316 [Colletotrichum somersetense]
MKNSVLVLAILFMFGVVAAQLPLKPPAYYGAPKKRALIKRGAPAPHMVKAHIATVASVKKPEVQETMSKSITLVFGLT